MEIQRIPMNQRMSSAAVHNGVVYLAGCCADHPLPTIEEQARETCANIEKALESAGSDKHHILSALVFLQDMSLFDGFNSVYDAWVDPDHLPVRTCVEAKLAIPGTLCEVSVIGAVKD